MNAFYGIPSGATEQHLHYCHYVASSNLDEAMDISAWEPTKNNCSKHGMDAITHSLTINCVIMYAEEGRYIFALSVLRCFVMGQNAYHSTSPHPTPILVDSCWNNQSGVKIQTRK